MNEACGNLEAGYRLGHEVRKAIDQAREQVASLIGAPFLHLFSCLIRICNFHPPLIQKEPKSPQMT